MPVIASLLQRFDRLSYRFALLLAIALLPVGLIALLQTSAVVKEAKAAADSAIIGVTVRSADREMNTIREAQSSVEALAQAIVPVLDDEVSCRQIMDEVKRTHTQYSLVAYVGPDLQMRCASEGRTFDFSDDALAQRLRDEGVPQIFVNPDAPVSGQPILAVTYPVADTGGFISISIPQRMISPPRTMDPSMARIERAATLATYTREGHIITGTVEMSELDQILPRNRELADLHPAAPTTFTAIAGDGTRRVYTVVPLIEEDIYALGSWPEDASGLASAPQFSPLLLPVLMWLASLFVAWFAAERLVGRHIRKLRTSMSNFAEGGRLMGDLRMENAPLEMRQVADSFVAMTEVILRDEAELENALRQKEVLLREVHHRVKNNLQLIASIMNLQMRTATSPEARKLLRSLQERVMSLATVHKELYHTTGLTKVHADELIEEISRQIIRLSSRSSHNLDMTIDAAAIDLPPDQAVPLALFVTEILTNALKFSGSYRGEKARIALTLTLDEPGQARLRLENSLSPDLPDRDSPLESQGDSSGLGHRLLMAFATQLSGSHVSKATDDGWEVELTFPVQRLGETSAAA